MLLHRRTAVLRLFRVIELMTGTTESELKSPARQKDLVDCREAFVRIARDHLYMSFPKIAAELKRDHTSILHLYRRHLIDESEYQEVVEAFQQASKKQVQKSS